MWRVQKKVSGGLKVLQYYTTKQWIFKTDNYQALEESLTENDKQIFYMDTTKVCQTYSKNKSLSKQFFSIFRLTGENIYGIMPCVHEHTFYRSLQRLYQKLVLI